MGVGKYYSPPLSPGAVKADYTPSYKRGICVSDVSAPILLYYTHSDNIDNKNL